MADHVPAPPRRPNLRVLAIAGIIFVAGFAVLAAWGLTTRLHAEAVLKDETNASAVPTVLLGSASQGPQTEELVLPGNVQAFYDTPVYARTNGYLLKWYVDIGSPVKAGQLMAEIDTPEVDDQLRQAEADLATAEANNELAQSTARRWQELLKTDSVSRQETEEKISAARADAALVRSNKANVSRLRALQSYKRVLAPYTGVVTARETDIGALINANGQGRELFRVADNTRLRVYVQVPQTYLPSIRPNMVVDLTFTEHPGKLFKARLLSTSEALDPTARTMLMQLLIDNRDHVLVPGGYTEAHLRLPVPVASVRVPVSALLFRADGLHVASVSDDQKKAILKAVTIGRDFGTEVEIVAGLRPNEPIIIDPPDSLVTNEPVRVTQRAAARAVPGSAGK